MKKFVLGTLAVVILILLLRNVTVFSQIIKSVTETFNKSFKAVIDLEGK